MLLSFFVAVSVVSGLSAVVTVIWMIARASENTLRYNEKSMYRPIATFVMTTFFCVFFGMLADTLT